MKLIWPFRESHLIRTHFSGIPFYGNMILWCDNTASWWPDIPIALAILSATVIMGIVCWDVYKKRMHRQGGEELVQVELATHYPYKSFGSPFGTSWPFTSHGPLILPCSSPGQPTRIFQTMVSFFRQEPWYRYKDSGTFSFTFVRGK